MARPGPASASPFPAGLASHPVSFRLRQRQKNVARPAGRLERLGPLCSKLVSTGARCGSSLHRGPGEGEKAS